MPVGQFGPHLGPEFQHQAFSDPRLIGNACECYPAPARNRHVPDIAFAQSAAGAQLNPIQKAAVRRPGRTLHQRREIEWGCTESAPAEPSGTQSQYQPGTKMAVKLRGPSESWVIAHRQNIAAQLPNASVC